MLVPAESDVREAERTLEAHCPAARLRNFADSGRMAVHCAVERNAFAVADAPMAALGWCCNPDAASGYTQCPVWRAQFEDQAALDRTRAAQDAAAQDALTAEQIRAGVRVDDREVEHDELVRRAHRAIIPPKPSELLGEDE